MLKKLFVQITKKIMHIMLITMLSLTLSLTACTLRSSNKSDNLQSLKKLSGSASKPKNGAIRSQSLRDTALSVGARGGLAWRAAQINKVLLQHENMLYRLFNFNAMLLDKNVLPPVLTDARNTLTLGGTDTIRIADRTFQIIEQAKFVTAVPVWRDYLWLSYAPPKHPINLCYLKIGKNRLFGKSLSMKVGALVFNKLRSFLRRISHGSNVTTKA